MSAVCGSKPQTKLRIYAAILHYIKKPAPTHGTVTVYLKYKPKSRQGIVIYKGQQQVSSERSHWAGRIYGSAGMCASHDTIKSNPCYETQHSCGKQTVFCLDYKQFAGSNGMPFPPMLSEAHHIGGNYLCACKSNNRHIIITDNC